ncbi:hypothetical protein VNO77_01891 [Canavalia gladiata]|uniref:Uncharacterized protein n=1 Tax=Canavalia gladiata TaxID=3824 RepID=A0AAN9MWU7_CANGL
MIDYLAWELLYQRPYKFKLYFRITLTIGYNLIIQFRGCFDNTKQDGKSNFIFKYVRYSKESSLEGSIGILFKCRVDLEENIIYKQDSKYSECMDSWVKG